MTLPIHLHTMRHLHYNAFTSTTSFRLGGARRCAWSGSQQTVEDDARRYVRAIQQHQVTGDFRYIQIFSVQSLYKIESC